MIQRIQSVYLLLTSLLSILFLKGSYLTFFDKSGSTINIMVTGLFKSDGISDPEKISDLWILLVVGVFIPLVSFMAIFLFKMRNIQLKFVKLQIVLILVLFAASAIYTFMVLSKFDTSLDSWYKLLVPASQLILSVLAFKGIKKDDELVKSYDRLR